MSETAISAQPDDSGRTPRSGSPAPVAQRPTAGQPGKPAGPVGDRASVSRFGGNPTGRAGKFKFPAGTPEGEAERREHERQRKAAARAVAQKLVDPPALPSAADGHVDAPQAPSGVPGPVPVVAPGDAGVPWDAEVLRPLIAEAIDATEESRISKLQSLATEADLPRKVVQEICNDAKYTPAFKSSLGASMPRAIAKTLNKTGISGAYSDEAICVLSMFSLLMQGRRLQNRLEKLINENREEKNKQSAAQAATLPGALAQPDAGSPKPGVQGPKSGAGKV